MSSKATSTVGIEQLRQAVPAYCWNRHWGWTLWYTARDLTQVVTAALLAYHQIPQIENGTIRIMSWIGYGYVQGLSMTGIWVLGHECGHGAFAPAESANRLLGFIFHSFLLTPYFSWASTHRRHHIYANNLDKDHAWVPIRRAELYEGWKASGSKTAERLADLTGDVPIVVLIRLVLQQVFGFQSYILTNLTSPPGSLRQKGSVWGPLKHSHYHPYGYLFRDAEAGLVILSDLGVLMGLLILVAAARVVGCSTVLLLYVQPYIWLNHWLVAITFLHHTHPKAPKYDDRAWTYLGGALGTVDRSFGWTGRFFFHDIIDYHTIHHIFP